MRRALVGFSMLALSASAIGAPWTSLWLTQEQGAQRLLSAGRPADAAPLFSDPRRRAYAELEAGKYTEAARRLASFTDPQSEYNRGNALAHSGDLRGALAAYDAALAQQPSDRDARHNRELIARALQENRQGRSPPGKPNPADSNPTPDAKPGPTRLAESRSGANRARPAPRSTQSEQSLSLDQWLRRIPDDPAELLQRKFMLEHMLRQKDDSR